MRRLTAIAALALVLALLCFGGCAVAPLVPSEGVTCEGKNLSVVLEENLTTGYSWSYTFKGSSLKSKGDECFAGSSEKGTVGVGGLHAFEFEGVSAGTTQVLFTHAQQWQGGQVGGSVIVNVEVGQDGTIISAQQEADAH